MKQKTILLIITLITVASFIGGASYAWFQPIVSGNDTAMANRFDSGTITLSYNGSAVISNEGLIPGDSNSVVFIVTNSGTLPVDSYEIYFNHLVNSFLYNELKYSITCQKNDGTSCTGVSETSVPTVPGLIFTAGTIAPAVSHIYTLTIKLIDTGSNQDYNLDQQLSFKIGINDPPKAYLANGRSTNAAFWNYKNDIYIISFEDEINIPGGSTSWDVSTTQTGEVMAYLSSNHLHIQSDIPLYGVSDCTQLFADMENLTTINNLELFNTSKVTNMTAMFKNCFDLPSIDLSELNTTNVTNMSEMFRECRALTSINLLSWQTSKVTDMSEMFRDLKVLTSLNVSTFDTSSVTDMEYMFEDCQVIESLDLSSFNTSKVTNMNHMFQYCFLLAELHMDKFDFTLVNSSGYHTQIFADFADSILSSTIYIDTSQLTFINARLVQYGIDDIVTVVTV